MRGLRREEKAIEAQDEMIAILEGAKYVTVAMCLDNEPYLVTLSHGYALQDEEHIEAFLG